MKKSKQNFKIMPSDLSIKSLNNKTCLIKAKGKTVRPSTFAVKKNMPQLNRASSSLGLSSKALSLNCPTSTIVLSRMFTSNDKPIATTSSSCLTCSINTKDYYRKRLNNLSTKFWSVVESTSSSTIRKGSTNDDSPSTTTTGTTTTTIIATNTNNDTINNRLKSNTILPPTQQQKLKKYKAPSSCTVYETLTLPVDAFISKNKRKSLMYKKTNTPIHHRKGDEVLKVFFIFYLIHQLKLWYRFLVGFAVCSRSTSRSLLQINNSVIKKSQQQPIIKLTKVTTSLSSSAMLSNTAIASTSTMKKSLRLLPRVGTTSFCALITIICLETILLSTMSSCAKTFYMHWNTSNSIFRIDNTDHIIDVNKGNLAFEFDQVHIICPVYEPGTFDNATEKYIIYNVSKVEYETCRITNADPRVIAICDKPQKLMFFTITFRPFTPQPGGLEFLPGNDYYFISTSSKDDLYRRIGGRCTTNNMKVVFKVCCAPEEKNKTTITPQVGTRGGGGDAINSVTGSGHSVHMGAADVGGNGGTGVEDSNISTNVYNNNKMNMIGIKGLNGNTLPNGVLNIHPSGSNTNNNGLQMNSVMNNLGGVGSAINTNIDQFNRIPIQPNNLNILGNTIGNGLGGTRNSMVGGNDGIILPHGNSGGGINMIPSGGGGIPSISDSGQYHPNHDYHGQSGIRINNVPSPHHTNYKNNGKDVSINDDGVNGVFRNYNDTGLMKIGFGTNYFIPPIINTNYSNIVQSTLNWPVWGMGNINNNNNDSTNTTLTHIYKPIINNISSQSSNNNNLSPSFHKPTKGNINDHHYNKHPNEVVKNEELTYNSGSIKKFNIISRILCIDSDNDMTSRNMGTYRVLKEAYLMPVMMSSVTTDYHKYLWNYFKTLVIKFQNIHLSSCFISNPMISSLLLMIIIQGIFKNFILTNALPVTQNFMGTNHNNNNSNNEHHRKLKRGSLAADKNHTKSYPFQQHNSNTTEISKIR